MYTLIRSAGLGRGVLVEGPSFFLSLMVAEIFYKFHSFTLECVAFLATWFAASWMLSSARSAVVSWQSGAKRI